LYKQEEVAGVARVAKSEIICGMILIYLECVMWIKSILDCSLFKIDLLIFF